MYLTHRVRLRCTCNTDDSASRNIKRGTTGATVGAPLSAFLRCGHRAAHVQPVPSRSDFSVGVALVIIARIEYTCVNGIFVRHVLRKNPREAIFAELAERDGSSKPEYRGGRNCRAAVDLHGFDLWSRTCIFVLVLNSFEQKRSACRCKILLRSLYLNYLIRK